MRDMTETKNWPKLTPTPLERAIGRFMRAPDHGADGDSDAGSDGADKSGADAGAAGGSDAGSGADGAADAGSDDSFLGAAKTDAGDGDGDAGKDADADGDKDAGDGDDKAAASDGPPETYELNVTVKDAEGKDVPVEIDQALLAEATPVLKELNLTNDQANKVAALVPKVTERMLTRQADEFSALRADWAKEARADKEIGGSNWKETETLAAKALDTFGATEGSEFRKLLNESGFGDHPEMIRMFRRIGEKLGEDPLTPSASGGKAEKPDRVRTLYPNDLPKEGAK
jgi:hypothetical protein